MIDQEVTNMIGLFWPNNYPNQPIPRPFDKRAKHLRDFGDALYADEADEWIVFRWYLQRIKEANGKRDAISHGLPGKITKGGRTYRGLMVPQTARATKYVPMKNAEIEKLAETISTLHLESIQVFHAVWTAQAAASPNKYFSQVDGKWTRLTKGPHNPKLPQSVPPPPTFQG